MVKRDYKPGRDQAKYVPTEEQLARIEKILEEIRIIKKGLDFRPNAERLNRFISYRPRNF